MKEKSRSDQITGGLFLIGLAILFLTGYWFPGIFFLIGMMVIAHGLLDEGKSDQIVGGVFVLGLGVVFAIGFHVGWLLLLLGTVVLLGGLTRHDEKRKRKNEELI